MTLMTSQNIAPTNNLQNNNETLVNAGFLSTHFNLLCDNSLSDGLARFHGVHPQHSFIVQAPAGSGKTSLLAQRFLALLSQVDSPEKIVAMTFTKKAAAEMRERILEALILGRKPFPENGSLVEQNTWNLAQKALQQDSDQAWSLIENPNRLRIKTIDGLNSYLVGQMPLLSKMGGQSQIVQDARPLYLEAVRMVLKESHFAKPVGRLLRLLNGRFNRAENMLCDMLAKRDQWMRTLIQYQGDSAREPLEYALNEIVEQTLQDSLGQLYYLKPQFEKACQIADYAVQNEQPQLAELCGAWPIAEDANAIQKWRILADWLLTKDSKSVRKAVTKNNGFPAGKGEAKEQKDEFLALLDECRVAATNHAAVLPALKALKNLPDPDYTDQQWQDLQWLIQLLTVSAAYLKIVFQQSGQVDYIEMAQAASQSLGSELEPTDLAQQLDYQIQHLLVDEFQDTSSEQFRLLTQLLAGWQEGDGRTLFLVGDPMQSIYRFREAEVGNFLKAWQGQIGNVSLQPLNLEVNFRSSASVVNWVNQAFSQVLPKENRIEKGAVQYSDSKAFSKDEQTAIFEHWQLNQSADEEALAMLAVIKQRLAELKLEQSQQETGKAGKLKKIAILGRSRSSLMGIALLLKQQQIAFRAVDLESLEARQEVQDMVSLSRALLHLADKAAWIALLRSPLVGLNLTDLHSLLGNYPYQSAWYAIGQWQKQQVGQLNKKQPEPTALSVLSVDGQLRLQQALPVLSNALQRVGSLAFATLVRETWLQLDGPLTVESTMALENVEVFCQTLASADSAIQNPQQLEKQLEQLFARSDSSAESQQIELMTMHKSKGLEFDTVILPGLGRKPRSDDTNLVAWFQFMDGLGEEQLVIAPIDQKGQQSSYLRQLLKGFENEKQNFELGRLLYVAATRAKTQLHLFGQVTYQPSEKEILAGTEKINPAKDSLLESLWSYAVPKFKALAESHEFAENETTEAEQAWPKVSRLKVDCKGFKDYHPSQLFKLAKTTTEIAESTESGELVPSSVEQLSETVLKNSADFSAEFNQKNALLNTTVGNLVHAIFEQMVNEGFEHWNAEQLQQRLPNYQQWLLQQGLPQQEMAEAMRRVEQSVKNGLANEKLRWALDKQLSQSATEYPLTSIEDGMVQNHIVDRTFVDNEGVRWIVDYKTSVFDGKPSELEQFVQYQSNKYQSQLERYGQLFNALEDRPQKWVLYFSYIDVWQELN